MNRLCIPVRLLVRFVLIACMVQMPCRGVSPLQPGVTGSALRGSCASIASAFPVDSMCIREDCQRFAPRDAKVEVTGEIWDPALHTWMFFARCVRPGECIPFWLRVPDVGKHLEILGDVGNSRKQLNPGAGKHSSLLRENGIAASEPLLLVLPGQKATLLWDQNGIRIEAQAVCLDKGARGDRVRARINRGKVVHAVVVSRELLKVES